MLTDPIADMLTRIRNGGRARLVRVSMSESNTKRAIAQVLKERGFISDWSSDGHPQKPTLFVELRYDEHSEPIIEGLERVSRPSRRVYRGYRELGPVRGGIGIAILSTPHGILTDDQARESRVGGEVLAQVW